MYFTNINNDELQYFKNQLIPFNFSMSLTSILSSSLFHIEDMGNSIYRIYPLFYCNNIVCSDDDNRILDNRCIIAISKTSETYFSFINNTEDHICDFNNESYYPAHSIKDNLSVDDFNRLVYVLRRNTKHYDNLEIKDDTLITTDYGEYTFDLKDSTVSDEGIIITPRTLENQCTVILTNPVFVNSKYYLHLKISKINNINLCEDDNNPISTSEIIVPLIRNVPVEIPFTDIELYDVIDFDASVEIVHSEPVLLREARITLTANSDNVELGESVTLNAVFDDESTVSGKTIVFKVNGTVIGSSVTNNNGLATLTYTPSSIGDLSISAEYNNIIVSDTVNVNVTKLTPVLLFESDSSQAYVGDSIILSGNLSHRNIALKNKSILIYDGETLLDTVYTDNNGDYSKTITAGNNNLNLKAVFEGDNIYSSVYQTVNIPVAKITPVISLQSDKTNVYPNEVITVTGGLTRNNIGINSQSIKLYDGNTLIDTLTTNSTGVFSKTITATADMNLKAVYEGNTTYNSVNSSNVQITLFFDDIRLTGTKNILSYVDNEYSTLTAQLLKNNATVRRSGETVTFKAYKSSDDSLVTANWLVSHRQNITCQLDGYTSIDNNETFNDGDSFIVEIGSYTGDPTLFIGNWVSSFSDVNIIQGDTIKVIRENTTYKIYKNNVLLASTTSSSRVYMSIYLLDTESLSIPYIDHCKASNTYSTNTNVNGVASVSYYGKGTNSIYIKCSANNIISNTVNVEDDCFYSVDGTGMVGTFSAGTDSSYEYITSMSQGLKTPINNFPSEFEFTFKFYKQATGAGQALLWRIGADVDNCLLVGFDDTNQRMRIYERVNGVNTVKQSLDYSFNLRTWYEATITIQNNTCSLTYNNHTLSYSLNTAINILQTFSDYNIRLTDLKIKSL